MAHQELLEQRGVEAVERADRVDDGVLRGQLEHHGDVAELQVGVDEHDRPGAAAGEHDGQVGGDHRLAGAALGGEDRDDLGRARPVDRARRERRTPRHRWTQRRAPSVSATRSTAAVELLGVDRRGQHVLHAGPQRRLQQVGGELVDDEDRAHLGRDPGSTLGELRQADAARTGRAEHEDERAAAELSGPQRVDRLERHRRAPRAAWPGGCARPGRRRRPPPAPRFEGCVAMGADPCLWSIGAVGRRTPMASLWRYDSGRPVGAVGGELVGRLTRQRQRSRRAAGSGVGW